MVLAHGVLDAQSPASDRFDRLAGVSEGDARVFFQRLRVAVGRDERPTACALLAYPFAHSGGVLASASDCETRYDSVFTEAVRKVIGKQTFDELFVNERGIMMGLGEVWIARRCPTPPCGDPDLRVVTINSSTEGLVPPKGKVLLVCRAAGTLVHVSADGAGSAELHLWRSGSPADAPTVSLPKATEVLHDDLCGARQWTFADGTTRYIVSTLSCDAHLTPPPMGAVGELVVKRDGGNEVRNWCDQ